MLLLRLYSVYYAPMPYNEALAERIRPVLLTRPAVTEKGMFGGIAFFVHGNMCCGIWKNLLVVRLAKDEAAEYVTQPHIREMDITGKPMKGWIFVEPTGCQADEDLFTWIERAFAFASHLPPK